MRGRRDATSAVAQRDEERRAAAAREILRDEARAGPKAGDERGGDRGEQSYHGCTLAQLRERVMFAVTVARKGRSVAARDGRGSSRLCSGVLGSGCDATRARRRDS